MTSAVMPKDDRHGRPIHLELCVVCDADKPAAAALIAFLSDDRGLDASRVEQGARLFVDWTREGMAAYGWQWTPAPPPSTN